MSAEIERRTETIPEWKQSEVDELGAFISSYDTIGIVSVTGIPSRQLQLMRADLHVIASLRMSRNTLIIRALENIDEGVEELADYVTGQVGIIGSDENPFTLYRRLEESKTPAPISAGEVAPNDIVIPEGDTGMDPGPFVGELQTVGAAAQIIDGSIRVTAESLVAESGEVISDDLANVLSELEIEPKEVGLDLRATVAEGTLFHPEELAIDLDEYRNDIQAASARAQSLSVSAGIPTDQTIRSILGTARRNARATGLAAQVESPEILGDLFGQADAELRALAQFLPEEVLPEELRGTQAEPVVESSEEEQHDEQEQETEPDAEASDDDETDDDDDDAAGEGIGAMFG